MGEKEVVERSERPYAKKILIEDLQALGVKKGMTLLVHTSMSKIGFVPGGPVTVIQALMELLAESGTLIMPTHTSGYSDPAPWKNPPVPESWHQIIRDEMPAFDPQLTPTRKMGAIAELFRTWPGVFRSNHPHDSFAAWGQHAVLVTADHQLAFSMGEQSPLARLYDLDGHVLLLGVGHGNNTSLHLSEVRAKQTKITKQGAPIMKDGRRVWEWFDDLDYNDDPFAEIGAAYEKQYPIRIGKVGLAESRLFSQRTAVDFATQWLIEHPSLDRE